MAVRPLMSSKNKGKSLKATSTPYLYAKRSFPKTVHAIKV